MVASRILKQTRAMTRTRHPEVALMVLAFLGMVAFVIFTLAGGTHAR